MTPNKEANLPECLPEFDRLWDFDKPADTETRFTAIWRLARGIAGQENYCAELQTQIARAQGLQRKFEDGHRTLDAVEAAEVQTARVRVRTLLERGRLFNSAQNRANASPLFKAAFEAAEAAGEDALAIDAAHMLGISEPPREAIPWQLRALAVADASKNPAVNGWVGPLLNNLGWTYIDLKDFPKALEMFERALAFRTKQGRPREIRIAKWAVARTLRSLGRVEESLAIQQSLQRQWQADGGEDGYVFEELAECLHALGRNAEASRWFAEAHRTLSQDQWLAANEPKRLGRLKDLSAT